MIVKDTVDYLLCRLGIALPQLVIEAVERKENEFANRLDAFIPKGTELLLFRSSDIREAIAHLLPDTLPSVGLDPIYIRKPDFLLQVTASLTDRIGLANRRGTAPLEDQIAPITARRVCVIDGGAKSGWTITRVKVLLESYGVTTELAVLGVVNRTSHTLQTCNVPVIAAHPVDMFEWVDLHDFISFAFRSNAPVERLSERVEQYRFSRHGLSELNRAARRFANDVRNLVHSAS